MQWSQLKKRIEERLAESVRGRIALGSTVYRHSHDEEGRGWIAIDKQEILNMATIKYYMEFWRREGDEAEKEQELHDRNLFAQWEWHRALRNYLNLSIDDVLKSDNPLVRAMGMLDARLGKRRLAHLDVGQEHDLVQRLYYLRCDAEHLVDIDVPEQHRVLTTKLDPSTWSWSQQSMEDQNKKQQQAAHTLTHAKNTRKVRRLVSLLYQQELAEEDLDTPISRVLFAGFVQTTNRDRLFQALLFLESKSELLETPLHARGVVALLQDTDQCVRPVDTWKPPSHNADRQFSSLARHLWAYYDVPAFMDKAWLSGDSNQQQWFKHLGAGRNIRTAPHLPVPLTSKMAHHFIQAPSSYSIEAAFRWGQVHALGGDQHLVDALQETRLVQEFRDDHFWLSVLRFFIRNPLLDPAHLSPIIDYIWHQRYEPRVVFVEQGVAEEMGPEQPNFSMRGRTVMSLLRAVEAWHRQLGKETKSGQFQWDKSAVSDFISVEGTQETKNMRIWRIRELLNSQELIAEGRQQRHCVATYARSCQAGICSIWTLEVETAEAREKLATIEVHNASKQIRQVRGRYNRRPTDQEKNIIARWAQQEDLSMASYL